MTSHTDATSKSLVELGPSAFLYFLGHERDPSLLTLIDADLSSVSARADKVIRVDDPQPWILHLEFQATWDGGLPRRVLGYHGTLQERHGIPVASVIVLLSRRANSTGCNGELQSETPLGLPWTFRYHELRLWEMSPDRLLNGPVALLPLAPLTNVSPEQIPALVQRIAKSLAGTDQPTAEKLWQSMLNLLYLRREEKGMADILLGLKIPDTSPLLEQHIRDSRAYADKIVRQEWEEAARAEGRIAEARSAVVRIATKRLGSPSEAQLRSLQSITQVDRLEGLLDRALDTKNWEELLTDQSPASE